MEKENRAGIPYEWGLRLGLVRDEI